MTHTAKHTPGPWKATGEELVTIGDQELFHHIIRDENERWTALVEIEDREGEANAHLIAAAPAMYEALQSLTSEIDLSKLNVRKDFSLMNAHAWAIKVILQAEGKLL